MESVACKNAVSYLRLSREDKDKKIESESITSQRLLVDDFCAKNGYIKVAEFVDDGVSGANFDRPDFRRMLDFIENSGIKVDVVVAKDLSRFGRDMMMTDYYLEIFFPERGIEFITVSEENEFSSPEGSFAVPFKMFLNDMYVRDSSRKVTQVLKQKMSHGDYCTCAPYGYMKNPDDKAKLIPNPETCFVVQEVFELAAKGLSTRNIAEILTNKGYDPPLKYRCRNNLNFKENYREKASDSWNETTVKRMIKNEVYLGKTILGKSKRINYKSKLRVKKSPDNWYVTEGTHEALVSKEIFDKANLMLGKNAKNWREHEAVRKSIFNGVVHCANCGGIMNSAGSVYKNERVKYWYLSCNNIPKRSKNHCEHGARIKYSDLVEIVKRELNSLINLSDEEIDKIIESVENKVPEVRKYKRSEAQIRAEIDKRKSSLQKVYDDYGAGLIGEDILNKLRSDYVREIDKLNTQLGEAGRDVEAEKNDKGERYRKFFDIVKQHSNIEVLDAETVRTFIDRIEIGQKVLPEGYKIANHNTPYKQNIKIYYRFIGELDKITN